MTIKNIFPHLLILGIILGIIFIVFTLFSKRSKDKPVIYLQFVTLFLTLHNLQIYFTFDQIETNIFERKLLLPWYALIIPAFYTFVRYYLKIKIQNRKYFNIAIGIFITELTIRICLIPNYYLDIKNLNIANYSQIEEILNASFTIFLFVKTFFLYKNQSKELDFILSFDKLRWLNQFMYLAIVVLLTWVFAIIFNLKNTVNPNIDLYYPLRLSTTFVLCWIAYIGFFRYNLIIDRQEVRELIAEKVRDESALPDKNFKKIDNDFIKIQTFLFKEKNYLNPDLMVDDVVDKINIHSRKISNILQENLSLNFVDYVNKLRVEKAKKCLLDPSFIHYTIESIGLECGFNSKSTFYRVFASQVGKTPTQYKKENGV